MTRIESIIGTGADNPAAPGALDSGAEAEAEDGAETESESESEVECRPLRVDAALHGQRLDLALTHLVPEFSRSYLQQLISAGAVQWQGRAATRAALRVRAGEHGQIELRPTPQSQAFVPEPMVLDVLFEDEHLRILNKPPGLVVHPAPGHWRGTLLNGLLARDRQAGLLPRAGIVHRLDKDTSGLMVVARTRACMDALVKLIAAREVSRQYVALAHRRWSGPATRLVQGAIGRDPRNRLRMALVDGVQHPGKPSSTEVALIASTEQGCTVRCSLHTGRTHQIRVHMASLGHPLVADSLYGGAEAVGLTRQALHAWRLAFVHPITGAPLVFHAPVPQDLLQAAQAWGLGYNQATS